MTELGHVILVMTTEKGWDCDRPRGTAKKGFVFPKMMGDGTADIVGAGTAEADAGPVAGDYRVVPERSRYTPTCDQINKYIDRLFLIVQTETTHAPLTTPSLFHLLPTSAIPFKDALRTLAVIVTRAHIVVHNIKSSPSSLLSSSAQ
jgi:hypothetical protein